MDDPDDVGISQLQKSKISPWRCRGPNLMHFLADPTVVGPLHKLYQLKLFHLFRALFIPSELVSRFGSVRRTNLMASMVFL
jgi:hypothetical protein